MQGGGNSKAKDEATHEVTDAEARLRVSRNLILFGMASFILSPQASPTMQLNVEPHCNQRPHPSDCLGETAVWSVGEKSFVVVVRLSLASTVSVLPVGTDIGNWDDEPLRVSLVRRIICLCLALLPQSPPNETYVVHIDPTLRHAYSYLEHF